MSNKNNSTLGDDAKAQTSGVLPGGVTQAQVDEWKQKHGIVHVITVGDEDDGGAKTCYLRKPTRKDLGHASTIGKKDPMKFNLSLLENCWLGGDTEIKTDDDYFMGAVQVIEEIITFKTASLKKI